MATSLINNIVPISPMAPESPATKSGGDDKKHEAMGDKRLEMGDAHLETDRTNFSESGEAAKQRAEDSYTPEKENKITTKTRDNQKKIIESINPENLYSNYKDNLSMNDPRGNINAKDYAETLALSRQADARNNNLIRTPTDIGYETFNFGTKDFTPGQWEKLPEITTEEMRQMEENRKLADSSRQAGVNLQNTLQQYKYELQRMSDTQIMNLLNNIGYDEHKFNDAFRQAVVDIDFKDLSQQNLRLVFQRLFTELGQFMNANVVNALYRTFMNKSPLLAQLYTSQYGTNPMPTIDQALNNEIMGNILQDSNLSPSDMLGTFTMTQMLLAKLNTAIVAHEYSSSLDSVGAGFNRKTPEAK